MFIPVVYAAPPPIAPAANANDLSLVIENLIHVAVGIGFVALTAMLFWAGVKFITSSGDPKGLTQAKQTVLWAALGILFLALAIIVLQLIHAFTGVDVTNFCLNFSGC